MTAAALQKQHAANPVTSGQTNVCLLKHNAHDNTKCLVFACRILGCLIQVELQHHGVPVLSLTAKGANRHAVWLSDGHSIVQKIAFKPVMCGLLGRIAMGVDYISRETGGGSINFPGALQQQVNSMTWTSAGALCQHLR